MHTWRRAHRVPAKPRQRSRDCYARTARHVTFAAAAPHMPAHLTTEIARRRTFAIVSHPDAGKTTLTEQLLLYTGALREAGMVGGKAGTRGATSDWMALERERGISISSAALRLPFEGIVLNLLDTPGHQDFSEDTYRTLTAADAAVVLLDAARGVQTQTIKLFEVCHQRGIPIFTFVNKLDRPARDPFDLLEEIERILGIQVTPVTWPIGAGPGFRGVFDRLEQRVHLYGRAARGQRATELAVAGVADPRLSAVLGETAHAALREQVETVETLLEPVDPLRVARGTLSPVFFGSVLTSFGVDVFLRHFVRLAPAPADLVGEDGAIVRVDGGEFVARVFKLQANLDRRHRDRTAFARVNAGRFERGMSVTHLRSGRTLKLTRAHALFADERTTVDEAFAGDIIGLVNPGALRIGDVLASGRGVALAPLPRFVPEVFATVRAGRVERDKAFRKGLQQLSEEGVVQRFHPAQGARDTIIGAVGRLQFDVFTRRMLDEYDVEVALSDEPFMAVRWLTPAPVRPGRYGRLVVDETGASAVLLRYERELDHVLAEHAGTVANGVPPT